MKITRKAEDGDWTPFEQLTPVENVGPYVTIYFGRIGFIVVDQFHHQCFFTGTREAAMHLCSALGLKSND